MRTLLVFNPSLTVDQGRVWQRMGYRDPTQAPPRVREAFEHIFPEALTRMKPQAAYRLLSLTQVDPHAHTLQTAEGCFAGQDLLKMFAHADMLVAWLLTLGPELEEEIRRRVAQDDLLNAYFLDVMASEGLIGLIRSLRQTIQTELTAQGIQAVVTRYWYCPGYGDWDLREQHKLFELLRVGAQAIGVRLNDDCVMIPRKSYAGFYGVGPALDQDPWDADIDWVAC